MGAARTNTQNTGAHEKCLDRKMSEIKRPPIHWHRINRRSDAKNKLFRGLGKGDIILKDENAAKSVAQRMLRHRAVALPNRPIGITTEHGTIEQHIAAKSERVEMSRSRAGAVRLFLQ